MKRKGFDALQSFTESVRKKIQTRVGLGNIIRSMKWLVFDHVVRMVGSLLITVLIARYLGPEQFGTLSYAMAMSMLFGVIAGNYLDKIVIKNIVQKVEDVGSTLGSAFLLKFIGAIVALCMAYTCVSYLRPSETISRVLVAIIGAGILFQSLDVIRLWFESQVQAKSVVVARNTAFIAGMLIKIIMIIMCAPLIAFAWAVFFETAVLGMLLLIVYRLAGGRITYWRVRGEKLKKLIKDAWPLLLSAVVTTVYLKIDQLMIGEIINDKTVGIYSVAVRVAEVWYFIPGIITTVVYPSIVKARQHSKTVYLNRLRLLYEFLFLLAFFIAIIIALVGDLIIQFLFGSDYLEAEHVLEILIWSSMAIFIGSASAQNLVIENLIKYSFYRTLIGAIVNVILNIVWIPKYGAIGAAYATLISYYVATYSLICFEKTFGHSVLLFKAIIPVRLIRVVANRFDSSR